jgi:hypothetical protein
MKNSIAANSTRELHRRLDDEVARLLVDPLPGQIRDWWNFDDVPAVVEGGQPAAMPRRTHAA